MDAQDGNELVFGEGTFFNLKVDAEFTDDR